MFDPDRFLDERVQKYLVPNPFIFLPFNAGPRICLGQQVCLSPLPSSPCSPVSARPLTLRTQFAYNEISFMLVRLLQRFSGFRLRQDAHPASVPPPGVERSPYAVDGHEKVWMRSHLTAYAKVRPFLLESLHLAPELTAVGPSRTGCGSRWTRFRRSEPSNTLVHLDVVVSVHIIARVRATGLKVWDMMHDDLELELCTIHVCMYDQLYDYDS